MKDLQLHIICNQCGVTGGFLHVAPEDVHGDAAAEHLRTRLHLHDGWEWRGGLDLCPTCIALPRLDVRDR